MVFGKIFSFLMISVMIIIGGCAQQYNKTTPLTDDKTKTDQNQQQTQQQTQTQQQQQQPQQQQQTPQNTPPTQPPTTRKVVTFKCPEMNNTEAEGKIKDSIKKLNGIIDIRTNIINMFLVKIMYDSSKTNPDEIKKAIKSTGYKVELYDSK